MRVGLANDHAAVDFKLKIKDYLTEKGFEVVDYGSVDTKAADDYPDFGLKIAEAYNNGEIDKGVLICGTGIGISISANKVPGIRAGVATNTTMARLIVQHNNANMIALGERIIGFELAKDILDAFFSAEFEGGRHAKRVDKIAGIEKKYTKNA